MLRIAARGLFRSASLAQGEQAVASTTYSVSLIGSSQSAAEFGAGEGARVQAAVGARNDQSDISGREAASQQRSR